MKKTAAALVLFAAALTLLAMVPPQKAAPRARALEIYGTVCQACHGPDGKAPVADMSFVGRRHWKHGSTTADIVRTITNGVPGTAMLPWKGRYTPAEILALAHLVRSFDKTLQPEKGGR